MNVLIIDGQGGKMGRALVQQLRARFPAMQLVAVGTNSIATANMLKAGADYGATGENAAVYNAGEADIIVGPVGIVIANALMGEVTPRMAEAIGSSRAQKILLPINRCKHFIVGVKDMQMSEFAALAVEEVVRLCGKA